MFTMAIEFWCFVSPSRLEIRVGFFNFLEFKNSKNDFNEI